MAAWLPSPPQTLGRRGSLAALSSWTRHEPPGRFDGGPCRRASADGRRGTPGVRVRVWLSGRQMPVLGAGAVAGVDLQPGAVGGGGVRVVQAFARLRVHQ